MVTIPKYLDQTTPLEERVEDLLQYLTLEEKIHLIQGRDFWTTNPIPRLHIPAFGMTDGPLGVAYHSSQKGKHTRFPASIGVAATWNKDLAFQMGQAMGKEVKLAGRHQILGPGVNIIRSPLCGRNFEYLSEDPVLSSDIAAEIVKGIQSQQVAACIKHYMTNCSETKRVGISTEISERGLQEIYVKNYLRIIEKADPWGLMVAYNKINGIANAENRYILHEILRDQLRFSGHVVSDWFAARFTSTTVGCMKAGLNLEMPGGRFGKTYSLTSVQQALAEGQIIEADLDAVVKPLLRSFFRVRLLDEPTPLSQKITIISEHQALAQQIAEESMVLLKNPSNFLPINLAAIKKIAILGPNAKKIFGKPLHGGSSAVVPPHFITPFDGIREYIAEKAEIVATPEEADVVFLILGLDNGGHMFQAMLSKKEGDTEGKDRTRYNLPPDQEKLIEETVQRNPNTLVILIVGSPVDCSSWYTKVPAILNAWYPGMMGGRALARVLFGDVSPSGKLPVTYPKVLSDHPAHHSQKTFPGDLKARKIYFEEGIYVGYRYFDKNQIEPFFPFGFGLSYTKFNLSNLQIDREDRDRFIASLDVQNLGDHRGAEVLQLYIGDNECSVDRPLRELQAFAKIDLNPGQQIRVSIPFDSSAFRFFSPTLHRFIVEPGSFTISVGESSRNLPLSAMITYE